MTARLLRSLFSQTRGDSMYVTVINNVEQPSVDTKEGTELLPIVIGPFETMAEAVGSTVDYIRGFYDEEPYFCFKGFGESYENIKVIVKTPETEEHVEATVNRCD